MLIDIIGKRYGSLVVTGFSHSEHKTSYWHCHCDCGNDVTVAKTNLTRKKKRFPESPSCGCLLRKLSGKKSPYWKGAGDISSTQYKHIIHVANRRGIYFDLTIEFIWNLFVKQNRKCALSGLPLVFAKKYGNRGNSANASLDRIDSSKGYVVGNVQWVHKDVNFMKQRFPQDYFLSLCTIIHNYNGKETP